jgi:hypothetical protein
VRAREIALWWSAVGAAAQVHIYAHCSAMAIPRPPAMEPRRDRSRCLCVALGRDAGDIAGVVRPPAPPLTSVACITIFSSMRSPVRNYERPRGQRLYETGGLLMVDVLNHDAPEILPSVGRTAASGAVVAHLIGSRRSRRSTTLPHHTTGASVRCSTLKGTS